MRTSFLERRRNPWHTKPGATDDTVNASQNLGDFRTFPNVMRQAENQFTRSVQRQRIGLRFDAVYIQPGPK